MNKYLIFEFYEVIKLGLEGFLKGLIMFDSM